LISGCFEKLYEAAAYNRKFFSLDAEGIRKIFTRKKEPAAALAVNLNFSLFLIPFDNKRKTRTK